MSTPAYHPKPGNPHTRALARRESLWQIYLPLILAGGAVAVLVFLTVASASVPVRSHWADISLILLIMVMAVMGVVVLAVLMALCYGVWYVTQALPYYFKRVQDYAELAAFYIGDGAAWVSSVVVSPQLLVAAARQVVVDIFSILTPWR